MDEAAITRDIIQDLALKVANLTVENSSLSARLNAAYRQIGQLEAATEENDESTDRPQAP